MKEIKNNSNSDSAFRKKIIIIFEIALLLTLTVLVVVILKGDIIFKDEEPSLYVTTQSNTENTIDYKDDFTFSLTKEDKHNQQENDETRLNEYIPATNNQNFYGNTLSDPSGWSTAEIIAKAKDAVNKTKAYTGNLTVNHSESFSANVTECSAGGIVRSVVDLMIGWVVKPVEETLVYQNGMAVNSEGETVPIILPKKNNFSLTEDGVSSASVQRSGNEYIIRINLVDESVGMYEVPEHNAASIGYLDVANFDISFMEVDSADIVYKGSSIELRINADGLVTYANYKIPLHIEGAAHKGSISGSAAFDGEQTEEWRLDW